MTCSRFSKNLRVIVAKVESVPGVPEWDLVASFPDNADFDTRVYDIGISPNIEFDEESGNLMSGDHGEFSGLSGVQSAEINFNVPINWGGLAATAPKWHRFLPGLGLEAVAYTTTGIGIQPLKAVDCDTLTIAVFDITVEATPSVTGYLFSGCKGNAVFGAAKTGEKWMAEMKFQGKFEGFKNIADYANVPIMTGASTVLAEKLLSNTLTIGAVSQFISSFKLDIGNDIQPMFNQADSTGYDHFYISARKPRFSVDPLMQKVTTDDVYGNLTGDADLAIELATANTHLAISIPRAQLISAALAEREGLISWDQNYMCKRNNNGFADANADLPDEVTWEILQGARA